MQQKIFLLITSFMPLLCWSQPIEEGMKNAPFKTELTSLDDQIANLKKRLHDAYLREMHEEVDGQGLMLADWKSYGQEVQKIKQEDSHIEQLNWQIDELEKRKAYLLKQALKSLLF
jgi:hypothetical protein